MTLSGKVAGWRKWSLALLVVAVATALGWIWLFKQVQRQDKLIGTAITLMAGYAAWLLWVLFASGWKARQRWIVLGGTVALIVFCATCLRIQGVTGDLLPIVGWRWSAKPSAARMNSSAPATNGPAVAALTNSYPQFLGPERNGVLPGPALGRDWKATPPIELWRRPVGSAWSGFAIEGSRAVTQEQRGESELVVCYDLLTGRELWSHADASRYATTIAGEGPRATPTIADGRVYAMGGAGVLNCLDLQTGRPIWGTNTLAAFGAKLPEWGVACSPLVVGDTVFVTVGGRNHAMVALHGQSGAVRWTSGHDDPHWSSPILATLAGVPQVVVFSENVSSYAPETGRVLWQHPWRSPYPHVSVPLIVSSNRVLVSQGYGGGSELLEITRAGTNRFSAQRIWKSIRLKSKFANLFLHEGFIYGLDDGMLVCLEEASGELKWKGERYGHGQMILVADLLLIMAESGDVVLVEPNPAEPRELARHKVFTAKTWNSPALAGEWLLVRNDREAACLRLPLAAR
jgi:outer membrane protein assembly factor BamB